MCVCVAWVASTSSSSSSSSPSSAAAATSSSSHLIPSTRLKQTRQSSQLKGDTSNKKQKLNEALNNLKASIQLIEIGLKETTTDVEQKKLYIYEMDNSMAVIKRWLSSNEFVEECLYDTCTKLNKSYQLRKENKTLFDPNQILQLLQLLLSMDS